MELPDSHKADSSDRFGQVAIVLLFACLALVGFDWLYSSKPFYPYPEGITLALSALAIATVACSRLVSGSRMWLIGVISCVEVALGASSHVFSLGLCFGIGAVGFMRALATKQGKAWLWLVMPFCACIFLYIRNGSFNPVSLIMPLAAVFVGLLLESKKWARQGMKIAAIAFFPFPYLFHLLNAQLPFWGDGLGTFTSHTGNPLAEVGKVFLIVLLSISALSAITLFQQRGICQSSEEDSSKPVLVAALYILVGITSYLKTAQPLAHVEYIMCPILLVSLLGQPALRLKGYRYVWFFRVATVSVILAMLIGFIAFQTNLQQADITVAKWIKARKPAPTGSVSIKDIPIDLIRTTVAMEDRGFYEHKGFEPSSIHRAIRVNLRAKQVKQGGSTITQQLAKNTFLSMGRTASRKFDEFFLTVALEQQLTKDEILEAYFNRIRYGLGTVGIQEASQKYFRKSAKNLRLYEAVILVSLVPSEPQTMEEVYEGLARRGTVINRIYTRYSDKYSWSVLEKVAVVPAGMAIYPDKTAWDRGATDSLPPVIQGVSLYSFTDKLNARPIYFLNPDLKKRLDEFCDDAHQEVDLVGLDYQSAFTEDSMHGGNADSSAHAYGQALDVSGFRFDDGSVVSVSELAAGKKDERVDWIIARLKKEFDVVIDWRNESGQHSDHIHVEVRATRTSIPREPVF